jgi:GNAT superfamily N-acetyltransferase
MTILHLRKVLGSSPVDVPAAGISVRHFCLPHDVAPWLKLRERAVAELSPAPRPWLHEDYNREMFEKPWWHAERNWLAIADTSPQPIGAATLAVREGEASRVAVVHWLLVDPAWRRRGIARLLMAHLERAAWNNGHREVQLETHPRWSAAIAFYQSIGYELLRERASR